MLYQLSYSPAEGACYHSCRGVASGALPGGLRFVNRARGNNDSDMWLWIPGVPIGLGLMLWMLSRLETFFIEPVEHAERITKLLGQSDGDRLEAEVARLLAPSVEAATRRRRVRRSTLVGTA